MRKFNTFWLIPRPNCVVFFFLSCFLKSLLFVLKVKTSVSSSWSRTSSTFWFVVRAQSQDVGFFFVVKDKFETSVRCSCSRSRRRFLLRGQGQVRDVDFFFVLKDEKSVRCSCSKFVLRGRCSLFVVKTAVRCSSRSRRRIVLRGQGRDVGFFFFVKVETSVRFSCSKSRSKRRFLVREVIYFIFWINKN